MVTNESIIVDTISRYQHDHNGQHRHGNGQKHNHGQESTKPFNLTLNIPKKGMIPAETQTSKDPQAQIEINRSSFLIERVTRRIPEMMDEQTFRRLLSEQNKEIHAIKWLGEDDDPIIDFTDLINTKGISVYYHRGVL